MTFTTSSATTILQIGQEPSFSGSESGHAVFNALINSLAKDRDGNLDPIQNYARIAAAIIRGAADCLDTEWDGYVCISHLYTIAADFDVYADVQPFTTVPVTILDQDGTVLDTVLVEGQASDGPCCPGSV